MEIIYKCPRCKTEIRFISEKHFEEEKKKKPFLTCPTCFLPYKINLDVKNRKVSVERLKEQVNIEAQVDKWTISEPSMPDAIYKRLDRAINLLKLAEDQTHKALTTIQALFDPMSAMFWEQSFQRDHESYKNKALPVLEELYNIYPFQVRQILTNKKLTQYLDAFSTTCPNCKMVIPKGRVGNCPYCKGGAKEEGDPLRILKIRFVKGEITKEEYEEMKKILSS